MKHFAKFMAGVLAIGLWSCSSEEPVNGGSNGELTGGGEKAYINVKINSAENLTRTTTPGNSGISNGDEYVDGSQYEHKVTSAKFFFFDEKGNYVLNTTLAHPAGDDYTIDDGEKNNVEWMSTANVLVLEDLTSNTYPTYMMTVLNMPDFKAGETIEETAQLLSKYADNFNVAGKDDNFVMSTSSYSGSSTNHDDFTASKNMGAYNVTKLVAANFKNTIQEAVNSDPVDVYVERLAAKVQIKISAANKATYTDSNNVQHTIYKLEQTVAGEDNDNNETLNQGVTVNTPIYIEVIGWALNATAKESFMSKVLKNEWFTDATKPFDKWNVADRYRSLWAYSKPYSLGEEVENGLSFVAPVNIKGKLMNDDLDYAQYCYENTNAPGNIVMTNSANQVLVYENRVTHVVLKTRICDEDGNALNMISFRGTLFKENDFKAYALRTLKNANNLNFYLEDGTQTAEDGTVTTEYRQIDINDIDLTQKLGSFDKADLIIKSDVQKLTFYKKDGKDENGKDKYVINSTGASDLTAYLKTIYDNSENSTRKLYWYNKGGNAYYIPIEHNALTGNDTDKVKEGYYGVVRNHWYVLDVNSFSRVGHALNDPDNGQVEIKPDEPEDPLYYVGARINILSWRIVSQKVDL